MHVGIARRKPIEVQFIQFLGYENLNEVLTFLECSGRVEDFNVGGLHIKKLRIFTPEDVPNAKHYADEGDYIMRGATGEFWTVKPEVFEKTYEVVSQ